MKRFRLFLAIATLLMTTNAMAYDFEENGLYFNILSEEEKTVEITKYDDYSSSYSGRINIPATITYDDIDYRVTAIGMSAFSNCTDLESVTIPNGVTIIRPWAFMGCTKLTSVRLPASVEYLCMQAFYGCTSMASVVIEDGAQLKWTDEVVTESTFDLGQRTFGNCTALKEVVIPASVKKISQEMFRDCSNLTSVTLSEGVESIEQEAFMNCPFKEIRFPESVKSIKQNAFTGTGLTEVSIPGTVEEIGPSAFSACPDLVSVDVEEGVKYIPFYSFYGCSSLTTVTLPASLTGLGTEFYIEGMAFGDCPSITIIKAYMQEPCEMSEENFSSEVYDNATLYVPSASIERYQSVSAWNKFVNIEKIQELCIGDTIKQDGLRYVITTDSTAAVASNQAKTLTGSIEVADTITAEGKQFAVTEIHKNAFFYNDNITSVVLPQTLNSIRLSAFYACKSLESINLPDSLKTIEPSAFGQCNALKAIHIPASVKNVGEYAFAYCTSLTDLTIEDGAEFTPTHLWLGESHDDYGIGIFSYCSSLTSVVLPPNLKEVSTDMFAYCKNLAKVTFPTSDFYFAHGAFSGCSLAEMSPLVIPSNAENTGWGAFSGTDITEVVIEDGVNTISEYSFYLCDKLEKVTISGTVSEIGEMAFDECNNLKTVISHIYTPFELAESVFTSDTYNSATLYVEPSSIDKYKETAAWNKFLHIESIVPAGISGMSENKGESTQLYDLTGRKITKKPQKGLYIVNGKKFLQR